MINSNKPTLYCDMDGVVADFEKSMTALAPHIELGCAAPDYEKRSKMVDDACKEYPTIFHELEPIKGAIEAIPLLMGAFDVYFLSTPMWAVPESYTGKRIWLEKTFGPAIEKRLILTHRKDLMIGDYLIDDRLKHGVDLFKGEHIHFGSDKFPNWESVLDYLLMTKTS